jgi:hypothetical protein
VKLLGRHGEPVPLRGKPHEQVFHDGIPANPGLAIGLVWVALRFAPLNARIENGQDARNITASERLITSLQDLYVRLARLQDASEPARAARRRLAARVRERSLLQDPEAADRVKRVGLDD